MDRKPDVDRKPDIGTWMNTAIKQETVYDEKPLLDFEAVKIPAGVFMAVIGNCTINQCFNIPIGPFMLVF